CESCGNDAHHGYNCPPKVPIISNPEPCHNQNVDEFPQTLSSFHPTCYSRDENSFSYDSTPNFVNDSPNVFNPPSQPSTYSYEFCENDAHFSHDCLPKKIPIYYDDDDVEESSTPLRDIIISELLSCIAITPVLNTKETKDSLIMRDEHLDTIPKKKTDEFIKSNVENLVPNLSESEDLSNIGRECDVPVCDDFTTFSNLLFDADDNFSSSDNESFYDEDVLKEIYSNPLFEKEIISIKIDPHHFNADSDLIESLLNQDSLIISSSKIDSLLDEFIDELIFLKSISPGIDEPTMIPRKKFVLSRNCYMIIRDNLFPERLLHDDPIHLPDILDSSNVVRIFPPFFIYSVTSILLSSRSENIIFDSDIPNYHFSSLEPCVSHRSGTFMKFNVYPNHLNESLMEILSSTCSPMDQ
nr:hypothetical protein [Tanacetum cinerariifolium]